MSLRRSLITKSGKRSTSVKANLEPTILPYPGYIYFLFGVFCVYLVLPIVDVPFLGLSISAPIMFIIAVYCIFRPPESWFRTYQKWIFLAIFIWLGIFISTAANGLLSLGQDIDQQGFVSLIQYLYWLVVFVVTAYFVGNKKVLQKIPALLGWSVFILALVRWSEALIFGRLGAWSGVRFLSQNAYGFQFSCFSPFLLILIFQYRGTKRYLAFATMLVVWGAAAINGSRGSWVAIALGLVSILLVFFFSNPRRFAGLLTILILTLGVGLVAWRSLPKIATAVDIRFSALVNAQDDKSVIARELLVQKGIRLFENSPLIGVGASRFTKETIPLDMPKELAHLNQSKFDIKSAHNSYIAFLAEIGLVGSLPLALLIIIMLFSGFNTAVFALKKNDMVPLAAFTAFIQMSIHMWVISAFGGTGPWFIYGLVAGMIMVYQKKVTT